MVNVTGLQPDCHAPHMPLHTPLRKRTCLTKLAQCGREFHKIPATELNYESQKSIEVPAGLWFPVVLIAAHRNKMPVILNLIARPLNSERMKLKR